MFRVFIDSNVIIETLLGVNPAARMLLELAKLGIYQLWTSQTCIDDINRFLMSRSNPAALVSAFQTIIQLTGLLIQPDATPPVVQAIYFQYMPVMFDEDDIPVLASALQMQPMPNVIVSGNTAHFNQDVAKMSGIPIFTAQGFLDELAGIFDSLF